jgi:hypothetical protein
MYKTVAVSYTEKFLPCALLLSCFHSLFQIRAPVCNFNISWLTIQILLHVLVNLV